MQDNAPELESVIEHINKCYRLKGEARFFDFVTQGMLSHNYIISAGNAKYFLKRYRYDDERRIADIHKVKVYFAHEKIPVILPIKDNDGTTFFKNHTSFYALFPFIEARTIKRGEHSAASIISTAQMHARTHLAGKKLSIPIIHKQQKSIVEVLSKFDRKYSQIESALLKHNDNSEIDTIARKLFAKKAKERQKLQSLTSLVNIANDHLIHGDYHDQNIFYTSSGSVEYIFDFELCKMAPRAFELIRAIDFICLHDSLDERAREQAKLYFEAYCEIYPLARQEFVDSLDSYCLQSRLDLWILEEKYIKQNDRVDSLFIKSEARGYEDLLSVNKDIFIKQLFDK